MQSKRWRSKKSMARGKSEVLLAYRGLGKLWGAAAATLQTLCNFPSFQPVTSLTLVLSGVNSLLMNTHVDGIEDRRSVVSRLPENLFVEGFRPNRPAPEADHFTGVSRLETYISGYVSLKL
jgi:hypothetical protein